MAITGVIARIRVGDIGAAVPFCESLTNATARRFTFGASVIAPAASTPNGHRAIVRHPGGAVFEYVGR